MSGYSVISIFTRHIPDLLFEQWSADLNARFLCPRGTISGKVRRQLTKEWNELENRTNNKNRKHNDYRELEK